MCKLIDIGGIRDLVNGYWHKKGNGYWHKKGNSLVRVLL